MKKKIIILLLTSYLSLNILASEKLEFNLIAFENGSHEFFYELLHKSLTVYGYDLKINPYYNLNAKQKKELFDNGELTLRWLMQSEERDKNLIPIDIELTNNLIGYRVLLIRKGTQNQFNDSIDLEKFRLNKKVGAFQKGWYDTQLWKANRLKYIELDDYNSIYRILGKANSGIDYFSRGLTEIVDEYNLHKNTLDIEKNLLFVYKRDFKFYLNEHNKDKKQILELAIRKAKETGLIDQLLRKHLAKDFEKLKINERTIIKLKLPE